MDVERLVPLVKPVQLSTWCTAACAIGPNLLVCCQDTLAVFATAADSEGDGGQSLQLVQRLPLFDVIVALASVHEHILAVTADSRCLLLSLDPPAPRLPSCPVKLREYASIQLKAPPSLSPPAYREDGIVISPPLDARHSGSVYVALSIFHDVVHVLRISSNRDGAGAPQSSSMAVQDAPVGMTVLTSDLKRQTLQALKPMMDPYSHVRHALHVKALELVAPGPLSMLSGQGQDEWMLAVLHSTEGPGSQSVNIECLEHDPLQGTLVSGPWACRNMHPTTTLISSFPGSRPHPSANSTAANTDSSSNPPQAPTLGTSSPCLPPGVLAISSSSLLLLTLPMHPHIEGITGGGAAGKLELLRYSMAKSKGSNLRLASKFALCVASPDAITFMGQARTSTAPKRLLFLGSTRANSQLLQVPAPLFGLPFRQQQQQQHQQQLAAGADLAAPPVWPLLDSAFVKSLAPIQDCALVPDVQGASDPTLLVGCGTAPFGRLARAKLGCALAPYFSDGPVIPEGARLFALNSRTANVHLAFSFDALGYTAVMQLQGSTFTHTSLPGLRADLPSLLLHTTPSGQVVQVTRQGVTLLSALPLTAPIAHWQPGSQVSPGDSHATPAPANSSSDGGTEGSVSLASACERLLVVATASHVVCLEVLGHKPEGGGGNAEGGGASEDSRGELRVVCTAELPHQVSALHVCRMGWSAHSSRSSNGGGDKHRDYDLRDTAVVMGFWLRNQVVVVAASDLNCQLASIELGDETARSAALLPVPFASVAASSAMPVQGQRWVLGVGTNSGLLLLWEAQAGRRAADAAGENNAAGRARSRQWVLSAASSTHISNVAVELTLMPDPAFAPTSNGTEMGACSSPSHIAKAGTPGDAVAGGLMMYAHSGSGAVVRARSHRSSSESDLQQPAVSTHTAVKSSTGVAGGDQGDSVDAAPCAASLVEVMRMHGSSHLRSLCVLECADPSSAPQRAAATSAAAGSSDPQAAAATSAAAATNVLPLAPRVSPRFAWVTSGNRLLVGEMDPEARLRWTTAFIGETPHHVAHHAPSGCFVMLSEDARGQQWLRLVHGSTLQPVTSMRLAPGHAYTSLLITPLPCSSSNSCSSSGTDIGSRDLSGGPEGGGAARSSATPGSPPSPKHFIVLGSHMVLEAGLPLSSVPGSATRATASSAPAPSSSSAPAARSSSASAAVAAGGAASARGHARAAAEMGGRTEPQAAGQRQGESVQGGRIGVAAGGVGAASMPGQRSGLAQLSASDRESRRARAREGAPQQVQGLLSVFEVVVQHARTSVGADGAPQGVQAARERAEEAGSTDRRGFSEALPVPGSNPAPAATAEAGGVDLQYSLLLHGTCAIDSVALSLAATVPADLHIGQARGVPTGVSASRTQEAASSTCTAAGSTSSTNMRMATHSVSSFAGGGAPAGHGHATDAGKQHLLVGAHDGVAEALAASLQVPPAFPSYVPPPEGLFAQSPQTQQQQQQQGAFGVAGGSHEEEEEEEMETALEEYLRQRQALLEGGEQEGEGADSNLHRSTEMLRHALRKDWNQRVDLQLVDKAPTHAGFAVTSLVCEGPVVVASDFMASVNVFTLQRQIHKAKVATGPSTTASTAHNAAASALPATTASIVLQTSAVDRTPVCASAAAPFARGAGVLMATQPQGMVLLGRDAAEEQGLWQRILAEVEADEQSGRSSVRQQWQRQEQLGRKELFRQPTAIPAGRAPSLAPLASCRLRHPITHIVPGQLGLHLDAHPQQQQQEVPTVLDVDALHQAPGQTPLSGNPVRPHGSSTDCFLALSTDGSVLQLELTQGQQRAMALLAQQGALEQQQQQQQQQEGRAHSGTACLGLQQHARSWALHLPRAFSVNGGDAEEAHELAERNVPHNTFVDLQFLDAAQAH
ncbi:hypothetical protein DUNSADRAFT_14170 [Dunaliella salina]|uniref:Uncharacterized protein n=1 Tax=Dunaliella salina TaxID=3046 RepID=A0ABQ7H2U2_DUNSA|nr:hypothetical protein DUNSADRAFT_14170 [Dunaliella salina]|eukprot:KAF5841167.1 hypothetical protein DUNSADRAFT_14170 [Dunaliella salina]